MSAYDREFDWDDEKSRANARDRGLPFERGAEVFSDPHCLIEEDAYSRDEQRFIAVGWSIGRILAVAYSEPDEFTTRLISVRPATAIEKRRYARSLP